MIALLRWLGHFLEALARECNLCWRKGLGEKRGEDAERGSEPCERLQFTLSRFEETTCGKSCGFSYFYESTAAMT